MAETHVSQADIDALGERLDALKLAGEQRLLLLAIVQASAAAASQELVAPPSFSKQFKDAFTPGKADALIKRMNVSR